MRKLIPAILVILGFGIGYAVFRGTGVQADVAQQAPTETEAPIGSAFTYQGRLEADNVPADGIYDFRFTLFDTATGDIQVGDTITMSDVAVSDGLFSVQLDFGAGAFDGQARWLEVAVREGESDGAYSPLAGRQPLTPAPYALHAAEAGSVAWSGLTDVPAGFADGVDDVGPNTVEWTDVQNRPAGLDDGDDDTTYTAGAGLALAGTTFSAEGSPYGNVSVVAKSGGDFSSVQAALDSIGDAGPDNAYLVYVAPGVYSETVTLKPYVTVEGAGEGTTIIRGFGGNGSPHTHSTSSATLIGADNAALRHLTVESDGTGQLFAVAIQNIDASPTMNNVTARAFGDGRNYGVFNGSSSPTMTNVTAGSTGGSASYGVFNGSSSSPTMSKVTATASALGNGLSYGVQNYESSPAMIDVIATGSGTGVNYGVYNISSSATMNRVKATASGSVENYGVRNDTSSVIMTDITVRASGGDPNFGVYNGGLPSPEMSDVTAITTGPGLNYAVYNDLCSPAMTDVTARASDGTENYGVYNEFSASPTMTSVTATAAGGSGSENYGVYSTSSSAAMTNVTASGTGGNAGYGVYSHGSSTTVRHSALEGSTASVSRSATSGFVKVANSQLIGPVEGSGLICFDNYDENLSPVTCP